MPTTPSFRPYPAFRLLAQCAAISLPLGVGGVDLAGRLFFHLPATALSPDQAALSAAATEAVTLAAVVGLWAAAALRAEGGVRRLPTYEATLESVFVGVAGAVVGGLAAAAFSLAWGAVTGGQPPSSSSLDSVATDAVAGLLTAASPVGAAALVTASSVLAPAAEELIYRGCLLAALVDGGVGAPGAVALSAAAFAASHAAVAPADVPALFGLGLALGATAVVGGAVGGGGGGSSGRGGPAAPVDVGAATLGHAVYNVGVLLAAAAAAAAAGGAA